MAVRHGRSAWPAAVPGRPGATHGDTVLPARATVDARPGDVVTIETPGGGGWGDPTVPSDR